MEYLEGSRGRQEHVMKSTELLLDANKSITH